MSVQSLGYIGLGVKDIAGWRQYLSHVVGCDVSDHGDGLRARVDSREWRIAIEASGEDDIIFAGWEVKGPVELEALIAQIEAAGTQVARDTDGSLAAKRGVMNIASFTDPSGLRGEIFWGATDRTESPFVSLVGVRNFVTGAQGLGHIVIGASDMAAMTAFYRDVLGFKLSDHLDMRMGPHMVPVDFYHCNSRHHTLAFAPTPPDMPHLIHFMLQVDNFDDVGFAHDRFEAAGIRFATTIGRHSNDHMLSFYAYTPSGTNFEIEFGFGAREIDDATWLPVRIDTTSSWGHKFIGEGLPRG